MEWRFAEIKTNINSFDEKLCKALLGITRSYPEAIYKNTSAESISATLLGPQKLERFVTIDGGGFPPEAGSLINYTAEAWNLIATDFQQTGIFPHVYALVFFLEVLAVGRRMLYRGQYNGEYNLESSLSRRLKEGWDLRAINEAKKRYIEKIHNLSDRRHVNLVGSQLEALCQHYGFPTHFLDFTWSLNIAAFFAIGGEKRYSQPSYPKYLKGSIWAIDIAGSSNESVKTVQLPIQMMRPSLQRGEFLDYQSIQSGPTEPRIVKFTFSHKSDVWIDELVNLEPYSITPLSDYLMPKRDPLEETASYILERLTK